MKPAKDRSVDNLCDDDRGHLATLDAKFQLIRDRVNGVVAGYETGLYLHGEGGLGKSHAVLQALNQLHANYRLFNSRLSGRGLYMALERFPDAVHLLEDMESLFADRAAQGVLRSALWAQSNDPKAAHLERPVTWTTANDELRFVFTGGIIMIANRPLDNVPELRAVRTRIACLHLEVTAHELRALMRYVAGKGFEHAGFRLEAAACVEVCEHVIERSIALTCPLDMRLLISSLKDRIQWEEEHAACHWTDLVAARLRQCLSAPEKNVERAGRAERKRREREIVREILAATKSRTERLRVWHQRTGKSQAAWYRRCDEVKEASVEN